MEATTAQASELERRVDLSIAIADVEKEMDQRLKRMGKNMKMSGFRPTTTVRSPRCVSWPLAGKISSTWATELRAKT